MQQLVFGVGQGLHQLPQFASGRGRGDPEAAVHGFVGGQVMHPGADAADPGDDPGHFLGRFPLDELFKPPKGLVFQPGVGHVAAVVEGDVDGGMALDARDGLYGDDLCHNDQDSFPLDTERGFKSPWAPENLNIETLSERDDRSTPFEARAFNMSRRWFPSGRTGP